MTPVVAILGNNLDADLKRAFQDLAAALQLRLEFSTGANLPQVAAIVGFKTFSKDLPAVPKLQFLRGHSPPYSKTPDVVAFAEHPDLPVTLRSRSVTLGKESDWGFLDYEKHPGDVAATIRDHPVWIISQDQGQPLWVVSTPVPKLGANQRLAHLLNGETFLPLLPLYLFLRALSPEARWQLPPLRACLVVDDPNLHAQTYGHIDFRALVRLAQEQPFHAAMATVPRDAWWTNARAAALFRDNPKALSLLVHGNDHASKELAQPFRNGERDALAAQSLARIEEWEKQQNIAVDRVMAPPHGVCAPEMFTALRAASYQGMTSNRWSLWQHNPPETLPANFGLGPADFFGGLPVANRFRFKSSICGGEFLVAALLGQPIIPYGHHQDFAGGMEHVRETLNIINSLPVRWMSTRQIFESNYASYVDAGTLHVRLYSRRVKLVLPSGITTIRIEPALPVPEKMPAFEVASSQKVYKVSAQDFVPYLPAGAELEIREALGARPAAHAVRRSPGVGLRRLAAEIRDRLKI